jgi:hypothetical protein
MEQSPCTLSAFISGLSTERYDKVKMFAKYCIAGTSLHIARKINPLNKKSLCFIEGLSAYRAVNTLHFGYKNQSLNAL